MCNYIMKMYCTVFSFISAQLNIANPIRYRGVNVRVALTVKSDSRCRRSPAGRRRDNWKARMTGVSCTFASLGNASSNRRGKCCKSIPRNTARSSPRAILASNVRGNNFETKVVEVSLYHSARGTNGTLTYIYALAARATRLHLINLRIVDE